MLLWIDDVMKKLKINFLAILGSWQLRNITRVFASCTLAATILHGAARGGAFENDGSFLNKMPSRLASLFGMAADDIQIAGLAQHDPAEIMEALHLKAGGSLVGFDASSSRMALEQVIWIKSASVAREYPNALRIAVAERKAIALWQHAGEIDLVDDTGTAMGRPKFILSGQLLLVTGQGAGEAALEIINQISAIPGLLQRVTAAARVGGRRWTLYMDSGVKVALPEVGVADALKAAWDTEQSQGLFAKGISLVDLRIQGRMILQVAETEKADSTSSRAPAKN